MRQIQQMQQQQSQPSEIIATGYRPKENVEVRWLFDYDHLLWSIRAKLYGGFLRTDPQGNYEIVLTAFSKPMLNPEGIENIMSIVNGFVDKIQATSNFDVFRINELCLADAYAITKLLYKNMEKYETTPDKATIIKRMIMNLDESNYRKSMNGQTLKLLGDTERFVQSTNPSQNQQRRFLGLIPY
jgi:hypothetical protein